ncbi:MAG: LytTR family transcriptional regulator DNA-binding domain-containing protein [Eubacteriales bacterium]|nr:LytTR family transcriptional regulator DNA-binding domain-containing protein [Eubacteriales bacterium]
MQSFEVTAEQGIRTVIGGEICVIPSSDIVYMESLNRRVVIHLLNRQPMMTKMLRLSFMQVVQPLLVLPKFVMIHQSFLVNLDHVQTVSKNKAIVSGDICVPVSKSRANDFSVKFDCWHNYNNPELQTPYFLMENLPLGTCVFRVIEHAELRMTYCSASVCKHIGYTREELIQQFQNDQLSVIVQEDQPVFIHFATKLMCWEPSCVQIRLHHRDGGICNALVFGRCVPENNATCLYMSLVFQDSGGSQKKENAINQTNVFLGTPI